MERSVKVEVQVKGRSCRTNSNVANTNKGLQSLLSPRLKKGDEQLDQTFAHASPPHHVPESICELTYTVYRARCLPIAHLRKTVRENYIAGK